MAAQYDRIAEPYRRTQSSPLRQWVEVPSLFSRLGDIFGCRVLELACGDGFYSRQLAAAGATVLAVDISPAMIELARAAERDDPHGVEYHCADVACLPDFGQFDLVVATYLLHYAPDRTQLAAMCANIARSLLPDGSFIALNENPAQPAEPGGAYARYGFSKSVEEPVQDGACITYQMLAGRELFSFSAHYYSAATYEQVLRDAGFRTIAWAPLHVDSVGEATLGAEYFSAYLANPPVLLLECRL
ncbi:MAG: methyltransferase domain-containing protein [Gammaproteobacteria bacterium]|nr:methyltransferase domain-containing protein [Gammaproteobacteria bacterium]